MNIGTVESVKSFFDSDENGKLLPGMKDYISVKQPDGSRTHCQKRLMYSNLKELHNLFTELNPLLKIGISTSALLRPKHCIFAGSSGTHTVCVCVHHENVKLMNEGVQLSN